MDGNLDYSSQSFDTVKRAMKDFGIDTPQEMGVKLDAMLKQAQGAGASERAAISSNIKKEQRIADKITEEPPIPDAPKLRDLPLPPKQEIADPAQAFTNFGTVLAVFGSLFTKRPMETAMKAMTSAMDGYHQGDTEKYNRHIEEWKTNLDTALKQNQQEIDQYKLVIDKHKDDINQMQAGLSALAAANGDEHMLAGLNSGQMDKALEFYKMRQDAGQKLLETVTKFDRAHAGIISDQTADFVADQILAGDTKALTNFGRGAQGAQNLALIREKVAAKAQERGISGADMAAIDAQFAAQTARARTIGTREGAIEVASEAVEGAANMALEASEKFDRTQYPSLNAAYQAFAKGSGDPSVVDFLVKTNTLINEYAAAQNPRGVPRVSDKEHAREILETAYNKGQFEAGVKAILQEVANIKKSVAKVGGKEKETAAPVGVVHWDELK